MATQDKLSGIAELRIAGAYYGGWKSLRVTRSIEQLAGTYELEITERWPGSLRRRPIRPGQPCQLLLDGDVVITGYVDTVMVDFDATRHTLRVSGRDKTADLVDCSAAYKTGQWHKVKIDQLARDLLKPYDIAVIIDDGVDIGSALDSFSIQEGESVFECLERAARLKALLLTSNPDGDLVITRAGKHRLDYGLVEGDNIKAARGEFSWKERFSSYTVKGQGRLGAEGDQVHSSPSAKVADDIITRPRPLIVLAEAHSKNATLKDRAEWERNVRRGRSARGSVTVQGWVDPAGNIWQPNTIVPVTSSMLLLDAAEMLIVGCTYTLDDQGGTLTELAISQPEAFQLLEGVTQSRLFGKLKTKEQRDRKEKVEDWSDQ
ncbi:phage baseplate assembly protein [Rhodocyclus tenuis]|uniref:Prophage tail gpP-like protein n=1 Tax=Rhodocyclus tenuis TaxID=1066 RepID=A0A840G2C2_RHOTE|nr:contractile injection system protein, VgrG/Pvc8 family [Rhodocyclus tenuis]MBB4246563.1 prophage tail gpP-like protein [Rhodocyclus tenuis]